MQTIAKVAKRRSFILILLIVCLAGCAENTSTPIRFGLNTNIVTLDPRYATDAVSSRLCRLIYQSLVEFNESFQPVPGIAKWHQPSPLRYVFEIEPNHVFHNGNRLTALDIAATYRSVLDRGQASPHRTSLKNIAKIEVLDQNRIAFDLHTPDPLFPGLLVIGILPKDILEIPGNNNFKIVGSGPFRLEGEFSETKLSLRRAHDNELFEFITVRDPTVRALKLANDELDFAQGSMSPELVGWLAKQPDITVLENAGTTFSYLGFNLEDTTTMQQTVRLAIAKAINREAIVEHIFANKARLAEGILIPEHWAGHPALPETTYDPELAKMLLRKVGYDDERPLNLTYKTSSDHFRQRIAAVIQDQLAAIGVNMEIQSYDWGTFYGDIKSGRFQMYSLSWVGLKLPDIFRYVFHSEAIPPNGANRGRYRSVIADGLIETGDAATALDEKQAAFRQLQELLLVDLPYVPLWYEDHIVVHRREVSGYSVSADGNYDQLVAVQRVTR